MLLMEPSTTILKFPFILDQVLIKKVETKLASKTGIRYLVGNLARVSLLGIGSKYLTCYHELQVLACLGWKGG